MSMTRYKEYKDSGIPWVGDVPAHWHVHPLLGVAIERSESNAGMQENNLLSLSYGRIVRKNIESNDGLLPESFDTYQIVHEGDIVLRLTDLQNDKRSLRSAQVRERGIITSAYLALQPTGAASGFLAYLLRAYDLTKVFYSMGGGLRQSMKFADLKRMPLAVPPASEQADIATFLDRETAKIDALIAEQEELIALLAEKRQASISHAVTKGLNPNAPMKDSGVAWLGEVPTHWKVVRLKRLLDNVKAGPFGSALTKDMYVSSGYRVYGQEQVIPADFSLGDYYINNEKYAELRQYAVQPGDILISCVGTFGKIAIVPENVEPGIINPRLIRLRAGALLDNEFLTTVLRSSVVFEQFAMVSRGGTMDVINIGTLNEITLALPPLNEQKGILGFLTEEAAKLDNLASAAELAIGLLKERRSALIAAAVTGQIDMRCVIFEPAAESREAIAA